MNFSETHRYNQSTAALSRSALYDTETIVVDFSQKKPFIESFGCSKKQLCWSLRLEDCSLRLN